MLISTVTVIILNTSTIFLFIYIYNDTSYSLYKPLCLCVPGLILHEEHIELLSEDFKALKRELEGKVLQEGTLHFTGERSACRVQDQ